jgi:transporter family-2 protein
MGHLGLVAGEYPRAVADHAGDARAVAISGVHQQGAPWMWAGGAFGVCFISLALVLLPKLGASGFMALALAGQVVASLVLDHFGWFGLVQRQVSLPRVLGALLLIGGVVLIQFGGTHDKALAAVG